LSFIEEIAFIVYSAGCFVHYKCYIRWVTFGISVFWGYLC